MTPESFQTTANQRFADNQLMRIRPAHFRAFAEDIRATFVAQVAANVPEYDPNYSYAVGTLVTFNSRFFRARREGFLPQPVAGQETTAWRPEAAPLEQLLPYRELSVLQAQDWASEGSLQPGTLYRLTGRGDDDVLAVAMTRHHLAGADAYVAGFADQTREPYLRPVSYDLRTDTTSERTGGGAVDAYTKAEADVLLANKGDLATQEQHTEELATLAARAANLYAHYADNTVAPFDDLDGYLAAASLHGGTLRLEGEATSLLITKTNRGGWPAFWDAAGATIVVPTGQALKSSAAGAENLTFGNFYLEGGGTFLLSGQLEQTTPPGRASRLFDGFSNIPVDNPANVVVLDGGYYKKITGAGKYYLTGTVQVDDLSEASNVVDLRGGGGGNYTAGAGIDITGSVISLKRETYPTVAFAANLTLDLAASAAQLLTLSNNVGFVATTNRAQGRAVRLFLYNNTAAAVTLSFPVAWAFLGVKPATLAAGKKGVLTLECVYGSAEGDIVAGYADQN